MAVVGHTDARPGDGDRGRRMPGSKSALGAWFRYPAPGPAGGYTSAASAVTSRSDRTR